MIHCSILEYWLQHQTTLWYHYHVTDFLIPETFYSPGDWSDLYTMDFVVINHNGPPVFGRINISAALLAEILSETQQSEL